MRAKRRKKDRKSSSGTKRHTLRHKTERRSPTEKRTISSSRSKGKPKGGEKVTPHVVTGWRLWLFRVIAVTVIPALLFLLLEITMRIVGYGLPTTTTIKCKVNDKASYRSNLKFAWWFFHPNVARTTDPFVFPADKSDDTYRVFVLGASAAAGMPDGAFCFGRILQVMLRQRYPQANFEVITAAMPAINSHVVLEIAKDCTRYQTDMFIVYLGNNEVVGPYGAGTVFTPISSNLSLIRFGIALKATKLGQLITNLLQSAGAGDAPRVWRGMKMFLEKQVRANDTNLGIVYRHFQRNLQDIRRVACKRGINVIFCTVASNLKDSPPFASLHRPNLTDTEKKSWDEFYQQGVKCETDGNYAGAVEWYLKAAEIDSSYADLQFRLGWCYWAMGKYDRSRERYIQARELDTLRFRADNRINEVIHSVASDKAAEGVYLIDAVGTFEKNSPHEIPGEELFYEHVHMNFKGNYLLAGAIFKQVQEILPQRIKRYEADERPFPTEAECARRLAYTDWDRYRIADEILEGFIKQAPFTNQLYHDLRVRKMEQKLKALKASLSPEVLNEAEGQYRWAIQQTLSDWWLHWKYGELLEYLDKYNAAAEQYRLVLNYVPHRYEAYAKLGLLFGNQGNPDAAITHNIEALRIYPFFADAYFNLGLAYHVQGRLDKAVENYSKAIRLKPDLPQAYNNLATILFQQDKLDEAVQTYRNGLILVPNDLDLHYNLGIMLEKQGHRDEALKELRTALQIDPNSVKTRQVLNFILKNAAD
ncbi:MAG: tetratricopeptide repeat protein [Phycisphaerae bacterium]